MDIETIVTRGLGNACHLIATDHGDAIVVDPPRDAWRILAVAHERGWRITHALETHVHNDYLSGSLELQAAAGTEILAPARGGYAFRHRPMDEGDSLDAGELRFVARATPGHTPEHLAWEIRTLDGPSSLVAVATGGSLMVGSAGRTDLLGPDATDELTVAQFHTLRSLATLPPEVRVLPTHGGGSFCAAGPADDRRTTSIGDELAMNPLLRAMDEATFRSTALAGYGPYPTYYREMAPINRAGPAILGAAPTPPLIGPARVREALAAGARVVDARDRADFAAGHLPGSLNIELVDTFASYVGWHVPFGTPLVLVMPEPAVGSGVEAATALLRIGYDRVVGILDGGVDTWATDGGHLGSYPMVAPGAVARETAAGTPSAGILLDVRDDHELRDLGGIGGARQIPHGELARRLTELPSDQPITVMCRSGARASVAASMLDAAGFDVRLVGHGGAPEILAAGGPFQPPVPRP
ncbi:MAG: MBL fold metallo-hydrolase [Chloroflexota bacterium]